jgi:hypothetical protein
VITGVRDLAPGEIEAATVAERVDDKLLPAGEVRFGVGRQRRDALEKIKLWTPSGSRTVPVRPVSAAEVKFFGRHRSSPIQDAVLRSLT